MRGCCPVATLVLAAIAPAQSVSFAPRVDFGMAQENAQQSVVADFDRDGNLDIATTMEGYNQGKVEVLFGDGQSDFGSSTEVSSYVAWGLCAGDFDHDGWTDLAATSHGWAQHGVRIWLNDRNGGFVNSATVSTLATPPAGVASGDFDGDGFLDLAAISEGGGYAVDWFRGNGNGSFGGFRVVMNTSGLVGKRIYTGKFNSDAHVDLVAIHQAGAMVLLNDSGGTGNFNAASGIPATELMTSGAVADLDGDGRDDIVTAGTNFKVWRSAGNGSFTLLHAQATSVGPLSAELGDIDGDGRLDALLVGYNGAHILFGLGGGAFSAPQSVATGVNPKAGVIGDWNGDGWSDIAISCQNLAGRSSYLAVHDQVPPIITATATAYGTGCGTPLLGFVPDADGRPVIGRVGSATVASVPSAVVLVMLGVSNTNYGGIPLPFPLAVIGMPGCDLLQSANVPGLPTAPLGATTRKFAVSIPPLNPLLGMTLHLQAYAYAPGQNALGMTTSNGVSWSFGNQ